MNLDYDLYDQIETFTTRLTMNTMNFLMKNGEIRKIPAGQIFAAEGEASEFVFIILEGTAVVCKVDPMGNQVVVASVGSGQMLGEMGVFLDHKRSATLVAKTDMSIVCFTNKKFINALPKTPDLTLKLLRSFSDKVNLINKRVTDISGANNMLVLGICIFEKAGRLDTCEIQLEAANLYAETKMDERKVMGALKTLHQCNLITKLSFTGTTFVFEAKISALKTYMKRLTLK